MNPLAIPVDQSARVACEPAAFGCYVYAGLTAQGRAHR